MPKHLLAEALLDLRRRLSTVPPRSAERRHLIRATAQVYGLSEYTLYKTLRERLKPRAVRRRDHGQPRVMPRQQLERYGEIIAALKLHTSNGKGRHLVRSRNSNMLLHQELRPFHRSLCHLSSVPQSPILTEKRNARDRDGGAMDWKKLLAYISGSVDQELLLRNAYLATENRILRQQIKGRVHLTDGERTALAEMGKRLGKKALDEVANITRGREIWCCCPRQSTGRCGKALCDAGNDWADCSSTTIERQHEDHAAKRWGPIQRAGV